MISAGELARELLACHGLVFLLAFSKLCGGEYLAFRTVADLAGLKPLIECPFCLGFWVALAVRLTLRDPATGGQLAACGAIVGAAVACGIAFIRAGAVHWRAVTGAAILGGLALPALAAVPVMAWGRLDGIPGEFLSSVGDAAFCLGMHEFATGSRTRGALALVGCAALTVLGAATLFY